MASAARAAKLVPDRRETAEEEDKMQVRRWAWIPIAVMLAVWAIPGSLHAINNGTDAGDAYPEVGSTCRKMTLDGPWECWPGAAILITPDVAVLNGHAKSFYEEAAVGGVTFDEGVFDTSEVGPEVHVYTATFVPHPDFAYNDLDFPNWLANNDVGVLLLDQPAIGVPVATLPRLGLLDNSWLSTEHTIVGRGSADMAGYLAGEWGIKEKAKRRWETSEQFIRNKHAKNKKKPSVKTAHHGH